MDRVNNLSLYSEYIKERENKEIIEFDDGFMSYSFELNSCHIYDAYVKPEHRKCGVAKQLLKIVESRTKEKGYNKIYCTVCPSTQGSTESLRTILNLGFKLNSSTPNLIILRKELE